MRVYEKRVCIDEHENIAAGNAYAGIPCAAYRVHTSRIRHHLAPEAPRYLDGAVCTPVVRDDDLNDIVTAEPEDGVAPAPVFNATVKLFEPAVAERPRLLTIVGEVDSVGVDSVGTVAVSGPTIN